ncbi:DNA repair protein rad52, partial [Mortierella sp. AD094]
MASFTNLKAKPCIPRNSKHPAVPMTSNEASEPRNDFPTLTTRMTQYPCSLYQATKLVEFTPEEIAQLNADLPKYLSPEFTTTRPGPNRTTFTYIEGWRIKNLANKLFGFDGWTSSITDVTVDFMDLDHDGKVSIGVSVIVKVTLKDGTFHEDVGYGASENQKSKAASFEKAKKEATTDGLKRALTSFGNLLGTCLYDKNFCKHLTMQKVNKPKFDSKEIYYCPTEAKPAQYERQHQHQQNQRENQHNHQNNQPEQQQVSFGAES